MIPATQRRLLRPLTSFPRRQKAVINVKDKDVDHLRWALGSALFPPAKDPQRTSTYPTKDGLRFTGIDEATTIYQIKRVEKHKRLAFKVFGWDRDVSNHRLSKQHTDMLRVKPLLIEKAAKFHCTWVKDFNWLLYDQIKHEHSNTSANGVSMATPEKTS